MGKEITIEDVTTELGAIKSQVREHGERALAEAKKGVDLSASNKQTVDELLIKQGELNARLTETEQKLARAGDVEAMRPKTAGEQLTASATFKAWADERNTKRSFTQPMAAITSLPASAGTGVVEDRLAGVMELPRMRLTVRDLITPGNTSSSSVAYMRELLSTNNAAVVPEGTRKPISDITFDLQRANVIKIAHFIKASTEILDDFPALQSFIDGRLRYGLKLVEEGQLLKGSGVGNNLNGIYTQAVAYVAPFVLTGATRIDMLRLAMLQASLAEFPPTGIVLHPSDWAAIELQKDTTNAYLFANPRAVTVPGMWGLPVVDTQAMTIATALVGAFRMGAQVFDRKQAAVVISSENEDDFVNNLITILCEERLALAVYRPQAFVKIASFVPPV